MSQATARRLDEERAAPEKRRPFFSFLRKITGTGGDPDPEAALKTSIAPEEEEGEFWHPYEGEPPIEEIQPMPQEEEVAIWWDEPDLTGGHFVPKHPRAEADPAQSDAGIQQFPSSTDDHQSRSNQNHDSAARWHDSDQENFRQEARNQGFSSLESRRDASPPTHMRKLETQRVMEEPRPDDQLDAVVDRLLRDKDFLLAQELKHKAEEINQLLVQAQRQKMKVELDVSQLESRPGNLVSWLDVKIFKEI